MRKNEQCHLLGDILRYYNLSGKVKAVSTSHEKRVFPVEFYVETMSLPAVKVTDDKRSDGGSAVYTSPRCSGKLPG